jgi:hypothetical protein
MSIEWPQGYAICEECDNLTVWVTCKTCNREVCYSQEMHRDHREYMHHKS